MVRALVLIGLVCLSTLAVQLYMLVQFVDRPIALIVASHRKELPFEMAARITDPGKTYWLTIPLLVLIVGCLFAKKNPLNASKLAFLFASISSSSIIVSLMKVVCGRARPALFIDDHIYRFTYFRLDRDFNSFPSGHAGVAMSVAIALALITRKHHWILICCGVVLAGTRVATNAHFLSDVIASSFISICTVLLVRIGFSYAGYSLGSNHSARALIIKHCRVPIRVSGGQPRDGDNPDIAAAAALESTVPDVAIVVPALIATGLLFDFAVIELSELRETVELTSDWYLLLAISSCLLCVATGFRLKKTGNSYVAS